MSGYYCQTGGGMPEKETIEDILRAIGYKHSRFNIEAVKPT
jgi:hypothetical protein